MEGFPTKNVDDDPDKLAPSNMPLETDFSELAPDLRLVEANRDVSYDYRGDRHKKSATIYEDSEGNTWYEIHGDPRLQMAVSLLANPFFHAAKIVEIPARDFKGRKLLTKMMPGLFPPTQFLSKRLEHENLPQKDAEQQVVEAVLFDSMFQDYDRSLYQRHNIRSDKDTYSVHDFDRSGLHHLNPKSPHIEDPLRAISQKLTYMIAPWNGDVPMSTVAYFSQKLKEIVDFYTNDGEKFVGAVLKKVDWEKYMQQMRKEKLLDESYHIDAHSLWAALVQSLKSIMLSAIEELKGSEEHFVRFKKDEDQTGRQEAIAQLNELIVKIDAALENQSTVAPTNS